MPLQIVHKLLCDKGMERFVGREAQEYPLSDGPKPSFIVRKIQLDGSFRDYLFDGTPCAPLETPATARPSPQAPQPTVTKSSSRETVTTPAVQSHASQPASASSAQAGIQVNPSGLTSREAVWLGASAMLDEGEEEDDFESSRCTCSNCGPFLPRISEEELLAGIEDFLGEMPDADSGLSQPAAETSPDAKASVAREPRDSSSEDRRQEQRQEALKKAEEAPRCLHIKSDGRRCGSAAIAGDPFCYFHGEARAQRVAQAQLDALGLPVLEDRRSLQIAIMQVNALAAAKILDDKTARILFTGLRLAQRNLAPNGTLEHRKKYRKNTEARSE